MFNHFSGFEAQLFPTQFRVFAGAGHFGRFGVDVFFVISGFIMIVTTWELYNRRRAGIQFLLRRCVRIYPPYWLVIVPITCIYYIAPARYTNFHPMHANLIASFLLFPQSAHPILVVSWTLVFEMYFYLIFSGLLSLPRRHLAKALGLWTALQVALWLLFRHATEAVLAFLGNPSALEFIFGAVIAIIYQRGLLKQINGWAVLGILPFPLVCFVSTQHEPMSAMMRVFAVGVPAALLLLSLVSLESSQRLKAPAFAISIGDASYALYLWHLPLLVVMVQLFGHVRHHDTRLAHLGFFATTLAFLVAFSLIVYHILERPMTSTLNRVLNRYLSIGPKIEAIQNIGLDSGETERTPVLK